MSEYPKPEHAIQDARDNNHEAEFRELSSINHWSCSIDLTHVEPSALDEAVKRMMEESGQSFSGYRVADAIIRTRYPRKKYGVPEIEDLQRSSEKLATSLGATMHETQRYDSPTVRIVLGLVEGYGENNTTHTLEEVQNVLDERYTVQKGEVYAATVARTGEYSIYKEPVAVIDCHPNDVKDVYALADAYNQERFTVDNLYNMKSHVVETRHCTSPDPE